MKRKKIYVKDIVTTLDGTDYIIIDDGSEKLKAISKTNFSSQIGVTIENKIVATEDNIIDFAAASGGYTFDERDMIQLAPDTDGNVLIYIFLGGTKTDVARYVKVDNTKVDWANILSKPITFNATAPTVNDDSDSGFVVGDLWMARDTTTLYKLTDATVGAAVWTLYVEYASESEVLARTVSDKVITPATLNGGVKRYKALLTQTGTNAPTAVILENTLGEVPVLTREEASLYNLTTSSSLFLANKTVILSGLYLWAYRGTDTNIVLQTDSGTDDRLNNTTILIEVYP